MGSQTYILEQKKGIDMLGWGVGGGGENEQAAEI